MTVHLEFVRGQDFIAEVIRTKRRKSATVKVEEGKVSVVVPESLPDTRIEALVSQKTRWVREKLKIHENSIVVRPKEYVSGESFTYLGRNYRLKVNTAADATVRLLGGRLVVALPGGDNRPERVRDALTGWFRKHAEVKLREKSERYAKIVGVAPSSVDIKTFKSRWGSCSTGGRIQLNWRIIITPNRVVDYVVVHELCHLRQHDHSPMFWKCVERVLPDHQECRDWLKVNGGTLTV
jgi:hypothetical protein